MNRLSDAILSKVGAAAYWRSFSNEALTAITFSVLATIIRIPAYGVSAPSANGTCTFFDYGALGFGLAATIAGIATVITGNRGRDIVQVAIGVLALLIGILRMAYGSGYIFATCG